MRRPSAAHERPASPRIDPSAQIAEQSGGERGVVADDALSRRPPSAGALGRVPIRPSLVLALAQVIGRRARAWAQPLQQGHHGEALRPCRLVAAQAARLKGIGAGAELTHGLGDLQDHRFDSFQALQHHPVAERAPGAG